jgi:hypothetical protein
MPRGNERKLVLTRLGQDLARIEKTLGYAPRPAQSDVRDQKRGHVRRYRERNAPTKRRRK